MKKVVYTVLSGGYDKIHPVSFIDKDTDYIIISDEDISIPVGWKLIIKPKMDNSLIFNRYYKLNPHIVFKNHDISLYIDSNIEILSSLTNLFEKMGKNDDKHIALYEHSVARDVYMEAKTVKSLGYSIFYKVNRQMNRYRKEGYHELFLKEANILLRRHNDEVMIKTSNTWWSEFISGVHRDQLSFSYACRKNKCEVLNLGKHDARFVHDYFMYHEHMKKNKSRNLFYRYINKLAKIFKIDS
ncbi:DUF616 domain-containing protein [Vibrio sp. CAIM 722]|uniref:DUF616 domain-containing protein n=1 Tax=Vibrio eleionomae TaxID=2653505 RepID=A0A7X4RX51_9VIBR|nr:glycosyltransferase domain-containing protein [Vibrio eleionomae]MZI96127.1 DUF616 domain-containing protein [Vibrio eleionomae]